MAGKDEEESFLSLEDDDAKAPKSKRQKKKPQPITEEPQSVDIIDAEILDTTVVEQAGGKYEVDWPLIGMDCPDCASKAMRGLSHLKQVSDPEISVTSGEIKLTVDLDHGLMSQVSSVMKSLGHPAKVPLNLLSSTNAEVVAKRNNIQKKDVKKLMMRQPGVLDVEITKDDEILLQLVPAPRKELLKIRDDSIETLLELNQNSSRHQQLG